MPSPGFLVFPISPLHPPFLIHHKPCHHAAILYDSFTIVRFHNLPYTFVRLLILVFLRLDLVDAFLVISTFLFTISKLAGTRQSCNTSRKTVRYHNQPCTFVRLRILLTLGSDLTCSFYCCLFAPTLENLAGPGTEQLWNSTLPGPPALYLCTFTGSFSLEVRRVVCLICESSLHPLRLLFVTKSHFTSLH